MMHDDISIMHLIKRHHSCNQQSSYMESTSIIHGINKRQECYSIIDNTASLIATSKRYALVMIESQKLQKITNNPVHIVDKDNFLSPTALIPFCEFGETMSAMGVKIEKFDVPVCTSFRPKIVKDQLCYTVDPNEYKDKINLEGKLSLSLFIHYNEDRQMEESDRSNEHFITIDTIGKFEILQKQRI